jgi:hypothetical protein
MESHIQRQCSGWLVHLEPGGDRDSGGAKGGWCVPHLPRYARMLTYRMVEGGKEGWHDRLGSGRLVSVLLLG